MKNRIPTPGQEGRVLITPEGGGASFYAKVEMADNPTQIGTGYTKEECLNDTTAAKLWAAPTGEETVNDVLSFLGDYNLYWWKRRTTAGQGDWEYVQSSARSTYPDSGTSGGYEYEYLGNPFDNAVNSSVLEIGSYVGTGVSGSENPNSFTFSKAPKFVVICSATGIPIFDFNDNYKRFMGSTCGLTTEYAISMSAAKSYLGDNNRYLFTKKSEDGLTISWYMNYTGSAGYQCNAAGTTYYIIGWI